MNVTVPPSFMFAVVAMMVTVSPTLPFTGFTVTVVSTGLILINVITCELLLSASPA